jgi:hypothetical protein
MSTGAERVDIVFKRLLSRTDFKDRFMDYLRERTREMMAKAWGGDGIFGSAKVALDGSDADEITLTPTGTAHVGTDGEGRLLDIGAAGDEDEATGKIKVFLFENLLGTTYHISYKYVDIPSGIVINPRTGLPQYDVLVEGMGEAVAPTTVTDNGDGTLTFRLDDLGGGQSLAGRRVLVYKNTPADGATTAAVALETRTMAYVAGQNRITTAGDFGQTVPSTVGSDYTAVLLGPSVSLGDTSATSGHLYIGSIVGVGAGGTAGAGAVTNQNLIEQTLSSLQAYDGGGAWADGTTNPATTIVAQLDKIIADLTATTGQRGAGKLTAPAFSAWADGTTNPAARLDQAIAKIITDLATAAGSGGAARVGVGARSGWADGATNPATNVYAALEKIIVDLSEGAVDDSGVRKIGAEAYGGLAGGTAYSQITDLYKMISRLRIGDIRRINGMGPFNNGLLKAAVAASPMTIWDVAAGPVPTTGQMAVVLPGTNVYTSGGAADAVIHGTNVETLFQNTTGVPAGGMRGAAYGEGLFVLVGGAYLGGVGRIITSPPGGNSWTARANGFTDAIWGVAYGGGTFVAWGGADGAEIATSPDGITWTMRTNPHGNANNHFAYGDGVWLAVGNSGDMLRSADNGATWAAPSSVPTGTLTFYGVVYDATNAKWVCVGQNGAIWTADDANGPWTDASGMLPSSYLGTRDLVFVATDDKGCIVAMSGEGGVATPTPGLTGIDGTDLIVTFDAFASEAEHMSHYGASTLGGNTPALRRIRYAGGRWWLVGQEAFAAPDVDENGFVACSPYLA